MNSTSFTIEALLNVSGVKKGAQEIQNTLNKIQMPALTKSVQSQVDELNQSAKEYERLATKMQNGAPLSKKETDQMVDAANKYNSIQDSIFNSLQEASNNLTFEDLLKNGVTAAKQLQDEIDKIKTQISGYKTEFVDGKGLLDKDSIADITGQLTKSGQNALLGTNGKSGILDNLFSGDLQKIDTALQKIEEFKKGYQDALTIVQNGGTVASGKLGNSMNANEILNQYGLWDKIGKRANSFFVQGGDQITGSQVASFFQTNPAYRRGSHPIASGVLKGIESLFDGKIDETQFDKIIGDFLNRKKTSQSNQDFYRNLQTDVVRLYNDYIDPNKTTTMSQQAIGNLVNKNAQQQPLVTQQKQNINNALATGQNSSVSIDTNSIQAAAQGLANFNKQSDQLKRRISYFFSINSALNLMSKAMRSSFNTVKQLDKAMTETAVVTNYSVSDMWGQLNQYTKLANELGATTQGAYETMTLFYQQGLNTQETFELGTEAIKMAKIANIEYAESTDMMTAALRGFNMDLTAESAQRIDDVYSNLAAHTAANTQEIATAMTKTASIANSAGMSFENTSAFLTQIIETTREAPETAGTAMKTVIARFSEVKKLFTEGQLTGLDSEGETIEINKIDTALKTVGISLNEFLLGNEGLDQVFLRLAEKWDTIDTATQRYIATMAAGSRQQSRFIAMMSNYERTLELVSLAENSNGQAEIQFGKTLDSLDAKLNKLTNSWNEFTMGIANSDMIKSGVDTLTGLLDVINNLTGAFGSSFGTFAKLGSLIGIFGTVSHFISKNNWINQQVSSGNAQTKEQASRQYNNYNTTLYGANKAGRRWSYGIGAGFAVGGAVLGKIAKNKEEKGTGTEEEISLLNQLSGSATSAATAIYGVTMALNAMGASNPVLLAATLIITAIAGIKMAFEAANASFISIGEQQDYYNDLANKTASAVNKISEAYDDATNSAQNYFNLQQKLNGLEEGSLEYALTKAQLDEETEKARKYGYLDKSGQYSQKLVIEQTEKIKEIKSQIEIGSAFTDFINKYYNQKNISNEEFEQNTGVDPDQLFQDDNEDQKDVQLAVQLLAAIKKQNLDPATAIDDLYSFIKRREIYSEFQQFTTPSGDNWGKIPWGDKRYKKILTQDEFKDKQYVELEAAVNLLDEVKEKKSLDALSNLLSQTGMVQGTEYAAAMADNFRQLSLKLFNSESEVFNKILRDKAFKSVTEDFYDGAVERFTLNEDNKRYLDENFFSLDPKRRQMLSQMTGQKTEYYSNYTTEDLINELTAQFALNTLKFKNFNVNSYINAFNPAEPFEQYVTDENLAKSDLFELVDAWDELDIQSKQFMLKFNKLRLSDLQTMPEGLTNYFNDIKTAWEEAIHSTLTTIFNNLKDSVDLKKIEWMYGSEALQNLNIEGYNNAANLIQAYADNIDRSVGENLSSILSKKVIEPEQFDKFISTLDVSSSGNIVYFLKNLKEAEQEFPTFVEDYKKLKGSLNDFDWQKKAFSDLYNSSDFEETLKKFNKTLDGGGKIKADDIYEAAEGSEILSSWLELCNGNASALASALTAVNKEGLKLNQVSGTLLNALTTASKAQDTIAKNKQELKTWNESVPQDASFYQDFLSNAAKNINSELKSGRLGSDTLDYYLDLFGLKNQYYTDIEGKTSYDTLKKGSEDWQKILNLFTNFSEGDFSGLWANIDTIFGEEIKGIFDKYFTYDNGTLSKKKGISYDQILTDFNNTEAGKLLLGFMYDSSPTFKRNMQAAYSDKAAKEFDKKFYTQKQLEVWYKENPLVNEETYKELQKGAFDIENSPLSYLIKKLNSSQEGDIKENIFELITESLGIPAKEVKKTFANVINPDGSINQDILTQGFSSYGYDGADINLLISTLRDKKVTLQDLGTSQITTALDTSSNKIVTAISSLESTIVSAFADFITQTSGRLKGANFLLNYLHDTKKIDGNYYNDTSNLLKTGDGSQLDSIIEELIDLLLPKSKSDPNKPVGQGSGTQDTGKQEEGGTDNSSAEPSNDDNSNTGTKTGEDAETILTEEEAKNYSKSQDELNQAYANTATAAASAASKIQSATKDIISSAENLSQADKKIADSKKFSLDYWQAVWNKEDQVRSSQTSGILTGSGIYNEEYAIEAAKSGRNAQAKSRAGNVLVQAINYEKQNGLTVKTLTGLGAELEGTSQEQEKLADSIFEKIEIYKEYESLLADVNDEKNKTDEFEILRQINKQGNLEDLFSTVTNRPKNDYVINPYDFINTGSATLNSILYTNLKQGYDTAIQNSLDSFKTQENSNKEYQNIITSTDDRYREQLINYLSKMTNQAVESFTSYSTKDLIGMFQTQIASIFIDYEDAAINQILDNLKNDKNADYGFTESSLIKNNDELYVNLSQRQKDIIDNLYDNTYEQINSAFSDNEVLNSLLKKSYIGERTIALNQAFLPSGFKTGDLNWLGQSLLRDKISINKFKQINNDLQDISVTFGSQIALAVNEGLKTISDNPELFSSFQDNIVNSLKEGSLQFFKFYEEQVENNSQLSDKLKEGYNKVYKQLKIGNWQRNIFEDLITSDDFSSTLDGFKEIKKELGLITGQGILNAADSCKVLADYLQISGMNAEALAKVLNSLDLTNIDYSGIGQTLINALNVLTYTQNIIDKNKKSLSQWTSNAPQDSTFFQSIISDAFTQIQTEMKSGRLGSDTLDYYLDFFGLKNQYYTDIKDNGFSYKEMYQNTDWQSRFNLLQQYADGDIIKLWDNIDTIFGKEISNAFSKIFTIKNGEINLNAGTTFGDLQELSNTQGGKALLGLVYEIAPELKNIIDNKQKENASHEFNTDSFYTTKQAELYKEITGIEISDGVEVPEANDLLDKTPKQIQEKFEKILGKNYNNFFNGLIDENGNVDKSVLTSGLKQLGYNKNDITTIEDNILFKDGTGYIDENNAAIITAFSNVGNLIVAAIGAAVEKVTDPKNDKNFIQLVKEGLEKQSKKEEPNNDTQDDSKTADTEQPSTDMSTIVLSEGGTKIGAIDSQKLQFGRTIEEIKQDYSSLIENLGNNLTSVSDSFNELSQATSNLTSSIDNLKDAEKFTFEYYQALWAKEEAIAKARRQNATTILGSYDETRAIGIAMDKRNKATDENRGYNFIASAISYASQNQVTPDTLKNLGVEFDNRSQEEQDKLVEDIRSLFKLSEKEIQDQITNGESDAALALKDIGGNIGAIKASFAAEGNVAPTSQFNVLDFINTGNEALNGIIQLTKGNEISSYLEERQNNFNAEIAKIFSGADAESAQMRGLILGEEKYRGELLSYVSQITKTPISELLSNTTQELSSIFIRSIGTIYSDYENITIKDIVEALDKSDKDKKDFSTDQQGWKESALKEFQNIYPNLSRAQKDFLNNYRNKTLNDADAFYNTEDPSFAAGARIGLASEITKEISNGLVKISGIYNDAQSLFKYNKPAPSNYTPNQIESYFDTMLTLGTTVGYKFSNIFAEAFNNGINANPLFIDEFANKVDFTNLITAYRSIQIESKKAANGNTEYANSWDYINKATEQYSAGDMINTLLQSDSFKDTWENLQGIAREFGEINPSQIISAADGCEELNWMLQQDIISAETLADILSGLALGDIGFDSLTNGLVYALDLANQVHNYITKAKKALTDWNDNRPESTSMFQEQIVDTIGNINNARKNHWYGDEAYLYDLNLFGLGQKWRDAAVKAPTFKNRNEYNKYIEEEFGSWFKIFDQVEKDGNTKAIWSNISSLVGNILGSENADKFMNQLNAAGFKIDKEGFTTIDKEVDFENVSELFDQLGEVGQFLLSDFINRSYTGKPLYDDFNARKGAAALLYGEDNYKNYYNKETKQYDLNGKATGFITKQAIDQYLKSVKDQMTTDAYAALEKELQGKASFDGSKIKYLIPGKEQNVSDYIKDLIGEDAYNFAFGEKGITEFGDGIFNLDQVVSGLKLLGLNTDIINQITTAFANTLQTQDEYKQTKQEELAKNTNKIASILQDVATGFSKLINFLFNPDDQPEDQAEDNNEAEGSEKEEETGPVTKAVEKVIEVASNNTSEPNNGVKEAEDINVSGFNGAVGNFNVGSALLVASSSILLAHMGELGAAIGGLMEAAGNMAVYLIVDSSGKITSGVGQGTAGIKNYAPGKIAEFATNNVEEGRVTQKKTSSVIEVNIDGETQVINVEANTESATETINEAVSGEYTIEVGADPNKITQDLNSGIAAAAGQIIPVTVMVTTKTDGEGADGDPTAARHGKMGSNRFRIPGYAKGRSIPRLGHINTSSPRDYEGIAQVGEEGPELIVGPNGTYLAGIHGQTFTYLNKDDSVYTAQQTKQILGDNCKKLPGFANGINNNQLNIPGFAGPTADFPSSTSSSSKKDEEKDKTPYENKLDKLQNLIEHIKKITSEIQESVHEQTTIEFELEHTVNKLQYNQLADQIDQNFKDQLAKYTELAKNQQLMVESRSRDIAEFQYENYGMNKYAYYDKDTGELQYNWALLEKVKDSDYGKKIDDYISKLQTKVESLNEYTEAYQDTEENIQKLQEDQEKWIEEAQKQYRDQIDDVYDAIVDFHQDQIDELSKMADAQDENNSKILENMQKVIDEQRKLRDLQDNKDDLEEKQRRLSLLKRDSSGANAVEIKKLEKEIEEDQENYVDSLVDYSLQQLQDSNDAASEQRQQQIELLQQILDFQKENGYFNQQAEDLFSGLYDEFGNINWESDYVKLMKYNDNYNAMTAEEQHQWMKEFAENNVLAQRGEYYYDNSIETDLWEQFKNSSDKNPTVLDKAIYEWSKLGYDSGDVEDPEFAIAVLRNFGDQLNTDLQDVLKSVTTGELKKDLDDAAKKLEAAKKKLDKDDTPENNAAYVTAQQYYGLKENKYNAGLEDVSEKQERIEEVIQMLKDVYDVDYEPSILKTSKKSSGGSSSSSSSSSSGTNWANEVKRYQEQIDALNKKLFDETNYTTKFDSESNKQTSTDKNGNVITSSATFTDGEVKQSDFNSNKKTNSQAIAEYNAKIQEQISNLTKKQKNAQTNLDNQNKNKNSNETKTSSSNTSATESMTKTEAENKKGKTGAGGTKQAEDGTWQVRKWSKNTGYYWEDVKVTAANGGLFDTTGLMQIDGTASKPELVLNPQDTKNFMYVVDTLRQTDISSLGSGTTYFDIHIDVDKLSSDYDVEQVANKIKSMITADASYRNNNVLNFIR